MYVFESVAYEPLSFETAAESNDKDIVYLSCRAMNLSVINRVRGDQIDPPSPEPGRNFDGLEAGGKERHNVLGSKATL